MSLLQDDELLIFKKQYLDAIIATQGADLDFYAQILESDDPDHIKEIYDEFIEAVKKESQ